MSKQDLRKYFKTIRKSIVFNVLDYQHLVIPERYQLIGIFMPIQYELDCLTLARRYNQNLCIPYIKEKQMYFAHMTDELILQKAVRIPRHPIQCQPDLIIVPLLAFDPITKHRLGYGGGFYDKYICEHPSIPTIGLGHDLLAYQNLPITENDQPLQLIITNTKIY